jgi:hypothetical protein
MRLQRICSVILTGISYAWRRQRALGCASFLAILMAIAGFCGTPKANATLIDVVWEGTVIDGYDTTGIFGGTRGEKLNLDGLSYVAAFRFDTDLGDYVLGGSAYERLVGGAFYGDGSFPGPAVSATITINGGVLSVGNDYWGAYERYDVPSPGMSVLSTEVLQSVGVGIPLSMIFNRVRRHDDTLLDTVALTTPYTREYVSGDVPDGHFQFFEDASFTYATSGDISPRRVTITVVPEPGSLAILGGLGLTAILYGWRRKRV